MIKHIVLWKLDESYSFSEKEKIVKTLKEMLLGLSGKIAELKSLQVHLNFKEASSANYDIMLETTFNSFVDLDTYQIHPDHLKVAEFIKTLKRERASIDFEL